MLHLNPYKLSVNGTETDAYYYVAVATKTECRHQGMMRKLLKKSLNDIYEEGHPFTYLMPANRAIYEPFDFRIVYQQKKVELPKEPDMANEKMAEMFDVYTLRDDWYVEKMLEEERVCAGEPPFEIVPYIMTRITHVEQMLKLLRSSQPLKVILNVKDEIIEENQGRFLWEVSKTESSCEKISKEESIREISVGIAELTEFVFGKRKIEGLESIETLSKICINEAV
jgi:predicted acetyltransferase